MQKPLATIKNRLIPNAVFSLVFLCFLFTGNAYATDYYVATDGSDANNGTAATTPFLTLQKASDVAVSGDVVYVRAGMYREMVDLKANGVTYQPYGGEEVTINGTDLMLAWTPATGTTYQTAMNWDVDPNWGANQVFADGKMIEFARWPDQTSPDIIMPTNAKADAVAAAGGNNFTITDADFNEPAARWTGAQIWVNLARNGHDGMGWTGTVVAVSGNTITVDFRDAPRFGEQPWSLGPDTEYFLFDPTPTGVQATGGVDALLSKGEWWKNGSTLYVKTPDGTAPSATGTGKNVIEAKRRHFAFWASTTRAGYTIKGFNLFACSITTDKDARTNRSIVEAARDITLDGLNVKYPSHQTEMTGNWQDRHYTWTGLVVSGRNNTIQNCVIRYAATSALSIQGFGIKVLNNQIEDANYMCSNSGAMNTGFICKDAEIGHNKIWNTTVMAINFKYSQNSNPNVRDVYRIHHNEIWNFMRRSGDSGAIDMVGQDLQWMRIDHNLIYNTLDDARFGMLKHGIYLDFGGPGRLIRATVDHNICYNITTPILVNGGTDVDIFYNVALSHGIGGGNAEHAIGNFNSGTGERVRIYNNILSHPSNLSGCCGDLSSADIRHNVTDARADRLNELFVNAAAHDYHLKPTATAAIDKGISVGKYDENVEGIPDLGAFEWGTFMDGPDTTPPSVPSGGFVLSGVSSTGFKLSWNAATDNIGVVAYEVYANGALVLNTPDSSVTMKSLTPSTTYFIVVRALDASGNRSEASPAFEAKTLLNDIFITAATTAPTIDGTKEAAWTGATLPLANSISDVHPSSPADLSGSWTSMWDASNLYVYVEVTDDQKVVNSGSSWWGDDRIEIFIDADGDKSPNYGVRDYQYFIRPGETTLGEIKLGATANVQVANVNTPTGYVLEVKIPFATLGVTPDAFKTMGIDVQVGDDDGAGANKKIAWYATEDRTYQNPSLMGTAQLKNPGPDDTTPPTIPVRLVASGITDKAFTLRWEAATDNLGVGSYEVYKNGNLVTTTTTNSIVVKELMASTVYSVAVKAKDRSGNVSALSSVLKVTTFPAGSEVTYEAEEALLGGAANIEYNHIGYTGTGFVAGFGTQGTFATFTVDVTSAGVYDVFMRYAQDAGPSQTLSLYVNGTKVRQISLPNTGGWPSYGTKSESVTLNAGGNTITYKNDPGDQGGLNMDNISLVTTPGSDAQAPTQPRGLQASAQTTGGFTLSWTASTDNVGVTAYEVFKNGVSLGTTASTSYQVTGLAQSTTWLMTVKATDAIGNQSDASTALSVTTATLFEAELAELYITRFANNHPGYTGTGFVDSYGPGAAVTYTVNVNKADTYPVTVRYGNGGGDQSLSLYVNGAKVKQVILPPSGAWSQWTTVTEPLALSAGENKIMYRRDAADGGDINMDHIMLVTRSDRDTQAPTVPTALKAAKTTGTGFTLSWTASTDDVAVAGYEVFKNGTSIGTSIGATFDAAGLARATTYSMTVKAVDGAGNVSAASEPLSVTTATTFEAEDAALAGGTKPAFNHVGYTGSGFVDNFADGSSVTYSVAVQETRAYDVTLRYANGAGTATMSVYVNGVKIRQTALQNSGGWGVWGTTSESLILNAGGNTIMYRRDAGDAGGFNMDNISLIIPPASAGDDTEAPTVPTALQASAQNSTGFTLSWTASTDNVAVTAYEVFKDGVSIGTTGFTTYNVPASGATVTLTVVAKDAAGNQSAASEPITVTIATTYEAELAELYITRFANNHPGYTGTGFVDSYGPGAAVTYTVTVNEAKAYDVSMRYGNGGGNTSLSLYVNGTKIKQVILPPSGAWSRWTTITESMTLKSGENKIMFRRDEGDGGDINMDNISLLIPPVVRDTEAPTAPTALQAADLTDQAFTLSWTTSTYNAGVTEYEVYRDGTSIGVTGDTSFAVTGLSAVTTYSMRVKAKDAAGNVSAASAALAVRTTPPPAVTYEAEEAVLAGGAMVCRNQAGYSGTGFVCGFDKTDASVAFTVDVPSAGPYDVTLGYSNSLSEQSVWVFVNKVRVGRMVLPTAGAWATKSELLSLKAGNNTIEYRYIRNTKTEPKKGAFHLDYVTVRLHDAASAKLASAMGGEAAARPVIYPNPVTGGWFTMALGAATADKPVQVIIADLAGRKVQETTFTSNGAGHRIETGTLAPGLYLVTTLSEDARWVNKIKIGY